MKTEFENKEFAMKDVIVNGTQIGSFHLRSFGAHLLTSYFTDLQFCDAVNACAEEWIIPTDPEQIFADAAYFAFEMRLKKYAVEWLKELFGPENVTEMSYTLEGNDE